MVSSVHSIFHTASLHDSAILQFANIYYPSPHASVSGPRAQHERTKAHAISSIQSSRTNQRSSLVLSVPISAEGDNSDFGKKKKSLPRNQELRSNSRTTNQYIHPNEAGSITSASNHWTTRNSISFLDVSYLCLPQNRHQNVRPAGRPAAKHPDQVGRTRLEKPFCCDTVN